jgi:hypothetical protein
MLLGKLKLFSRLGGQCLPTPTSFRQSKDVVYTNSSTNPSGIRNFSITIGQANYSETGHFLQYTSTEYLDKAKTAAESTRYYGLHEAI